jgi:hypothetical protein
MDMRRIKTNLRFLGLSFGQDRKSQTTQILCARHYFSVFFVLLLQKYYLNFNEACKACCPGCRRSGCYSQS